MATSSQERLTQIAGHMATNTVFGHVREAPVDPLFGLMAAYRADNNEKKVDLGIGAYRDDNAKPWILPVVKKADAIIAADPNLNHEYLGITGLPAFTSAAQKLVFGADSPAIKERRITTCQSVSGTGALHLGALFLSKFLPSKDIKIYLSNPSWANHKAIFANVNLSTMEYPYFDKKTKGLDFAGMTSTLKSAPEGSVILLHACAHNPTGVDPTQEQWKQVAQIMKERNLYPYFDTAYQGFASGNLDKDAWAIRYFLSQGFGMLVAESFAKNLGLYGERCGAAHFIASPGAEAEKITKNVASQIAVLQRSEISNPPAYGARIASLILNDKELFAQWEEDLKTMSGRIIDMRKALRAELERLQTPGSWEHITSQIGMFSFTGLTEPQVAKLIKDHHVYLTKNGRISMAGLNTKNIAYFAKAVDSVVRETH